MVTRRFRTSDTEQQLTLKKSIRLISTFLINIRYSLKYFFSRLESYTDFYQKIIFVNNKSFQRVYKRHNKYNSGSRLRPVQSSRLHVFKDFTVLLHTAGYRVQSRITIQLLPAILQSTGW